MFFYLIVISLVVGLPGLILFTLGLLNKKKGMWITGIALTLMALLIFVYAFVRVINKTSNVIDRFSRWEKRNSPVNPDDSLHLKDKNTYYDTTFENGKVKIKLYQGKYVAGFIKGTDNELVLITIKISNQLKSKGISIDKIEEYSLKQPKRNIVPLKLSFTENFKGIIVLAAYGEGTSEIASTNVNCTATKGSEKKVEFEFDKTVKFSEIEYGILYDSIP